MAHVFTGLQADLRFRPHRLLDNFHFFTHSLTSLTAARDERQFQGVGAADS